MVFDEDCGCLNICYILVRRPVARVPVATARALMFDKIIPRPAKY